MTAQRKEQPQEKHPYIQAIIPLDKIERALQVRRNLPSSEAQTALHELADSIRGHGILQPILVSPIEGSDTYKLIAGHRRYQAALLAGHEYMPALITHAEGAEAVILQVLENVQREDLTPVDEGRAYIEILDRFKVTKAALARTLGKSTSYITLRMKVAADAFWSQAVAQGRIAASTAQFILTMKEEEQEEFRRRVEAGEKLTYYDYIAAITKRVEEGNEGAKAFPPNRAQGMYSPSRLAREQTVHGAQRALGRPESNVVMRQDAPDQPVYLVPNRHGELPQTPQSSERHLATISELIDALPRPALVRLLSLAAEQGMTCAQLLDEVRTHG